MLSCLQAQPVLNVPGLMVQVENTNLPPGFNNCTATCSNFRWYLAVCTAHNSKHNVNDASPFGEDKCLVAATALQV